MKKETFTLFLFPLLFAKSDIAIGQALTGKVGINTETPTEALDVDGKIRIRTGAQNGYLLLSDSLGTGSWTKPGDLVTKGSSALCVSDFGALGDGKTDNTTSFQKAIDSAAFLGGKICVPYGTYKISGTLNIPAGVILEGFGTGNNPLATPSNGSIIKYTGNNWAIKIAGSNAGLRDLVIYDDNNAGAAGGINISANGNLVESCKLENVLISGFTDGTSLNLEAINNSGIAYCTFQDIRIRHAKKGIHISQDAGSFVNSNAFYHGAISGGGFDYCLFVQGGNNNVFDGMVFEPYSSVKGHLVVEKGSITGNHIRIEGSQQASEIPLINFRTGTSGSYIDGLYGGGLILNEGDNFVNLRSGKAIGVDDTGFNVFMNAGFRGFASGNIPNWTITGNGINALMAPPEIFPGHFVLSLTIPSGIVSTLKPDQKSLPLVLSDPRYSLCNFGFYVKCDKPGIVFTTLNAPAGLTSSAPHPGDNKWHFIGMSAIVNPTQPIAPTLRIDNSKPGGNTIINITSPTFCFGNKIPYPISAPITSDGGVINGTLTTSMFTVQSATTLVLPKAGNVFIVDGNTAITKINQLIADRFPKGTIITLLFNQANLSLNQSGYLLLKATFSSTVNSSITLISLGDGTWRELQRNL